VSNPHKFVQDLLRLVKPGGILYIETPNSDSHLFYVEKEKYTFLIPPEHLWLFSFDSIRHLLPKNTETIYINTYSYPEHLMGIVKKMIHKVRYVILNPPVRRMKNPASETSEKKRAEFILGNVEGLDPSAYRLRMTQKNLSYFLFDRLLAPLFTGLLNLYHKGSILELYTRKKK
jgi:hypothetical protein